jgi:ABC-2 type transport system ATP-binding protein
MLEVKNLRKQFEDQLAVNNVSFTVGDYERVALLGPNGAGKTTTLMMILGVTTPDTGDVELNGKSIRDQRADFLEDVGFTAAYMTTPRSITVRESLRVSAGLVGLPLKSPEIDEMIERFEIRDLVERKGGELSSGQKTLVGLARAALGRPKLFVLDEPTAYLDPHMSLTVREMIDDVCREWNSSLLITSHNMRDIDHLCDRVVFLHHGAVLYDVAPAELRRVVGTDDLDDAFIDLARAEKGGDNRASA